MKFQNQTTGLEAAFRGFNRINQILSDNWTDSNLTAFNATYLTPINSNGIKNIQETQAHFSAIDKALGQLSQDLYELDQSINRSKDYVESNIEGCIICHCQVQNRFGEGEMKGFLIPKDQAKYANDKDLLEDLARVKLPEYEDYRDFNSYEQIILRPY